MRYASDSSLLTPGRARYSKVPHGYEQVPGEAARKVIVEQAREVEAADA